MAEKFKRSLWSGWVRSSDGYAVLLGARTGLDYRDERGEIHIDAEDLMNDANEVLVFTKSIPDTSERPKTEVLDRLRRVFEHQGWTLVPMENT